MEPERVFDQLFTAAREADEFEYASALLRIRGAEAVGWDPLQETQALYGDIGSLIEAPLADYARIRLGLLLYCHLTEVDAIYEIIMNMVEVTAGARCVISPFGDLYRPRRSPLYERNPPSAKRVVERLKETARQRNRGEIAELLEWFFDDSIRNAFFHSDYVLYADEFRSREGTFINDDNIRTASMKLPTVMERINRATAFFHGFMTTYAAHRLSYRKDKVVRGRLGAGGEVIEVTLLADERGGLYGFRA